MKVQKVLLRAVAKKISWWQAAEIKTLLRPEHAAFPRETRRGARHRVELHVGTESVARSGSGSETQQARDAPQKTAPAAHGRDAAAYRWQQALLVQNSRRYDLIVILDDATNEIYHAQLVEEESTRTVMAGLREVIETKAYSVPCTAIEAVTSSIPRRPASRSTSIV